MFKFAIALALAAPPANPAIDMDGHLQLSREAALHRRTRRVSEDEFIRLSREPGTVILDARSRPKFDLLHIRGALHLSFPDITVESLRRALPDKDTRILIYCNNNFRNEEAAFPTKMPAASLNLSTYVTLYTYGYRSVYELGPQLDPATTKLPLVAATPSSTSPPRGSAARGRAATHPPTPTPGNTAGR